MPAAPPVREVLAAGFTRNDHEAGGQGFAAGGPLDQMAPGPVLAGFAAGAWDGGLAVLSDDELVGVLSAARRLASWASALELTAVAGLGSRRAAEARASGDQRGAEHVSDEVAAALTLTCRAADRLVSLAAGVMRLPAVAAALAAGRIDMPRAIIFTGELAGLGDVEAAAVAALVAAGAPGLTTGQLRGVLHRAVLALDPDAARKRRERAQQDARVECWTEPAGTWSLAGRDLPPAEALAADQHIDAAARDLKNAGADGTLEQLRGAVFLALLSGRPLYTLLPGQAGDTGTTAGHQDRGGPGPAGQDSDSAADQDSDSAADQDGNGDRDGGGDGDGDGGDGEGGSRRPRPGPGPDAPPGGAGRPPGPAGLTGTVNFTVPLTTWLGLAGGPGEAAGYGHLDAAASRDLAAAITASPGSRWCLTITSPDGHAIGHACARKGHPPPGNRAPPGGTGPPRSGTSPRPGRIKINWLETGDCTHERETRSYQPSNLLRHLVKTRGRTCSFPGCRRAARRCDDDHTLPFDQGGRTCECNLAALCRRHHSAKQAPGWHLRQPQPGTLVWTLPSGRTYITRPSPYPA
jgi:hypothetical protein